MAVKLNKITDRIQHRGRYYYVVNAIVDGEKLLLLKLHHEMADQPELIKEFEERQAQSTTEENDAGPKDASLDNSSGESSIGASQSSTKATEGSAAGEIETAHVELTLSQSLAQPPGGLKYYDDNCFINAVTQLLYAVVPIRTALLNFDAPMEVPDAIATSLSRVFHEMSTTNLVYVSGFLRTVLNSPGFGDFRKGRRGSIGCNQSDAQEFFIKITDALRDSLPIVNNNAGRLSLVYQTFHCSTVYKRINLQTSNEQEITDNFLSIMSDIGPACVDIYSGIKSELRHRDEERDHHSSDKRISRLPSYLVLQLKRFFFVRTNKTSHKLNQRQDFYMNLDVSEFCTPALQQQIKQSRQSGHRRSFENDPGSNATGLYELKGVISHGGAGTGCGHYIGWMRHTVRQEDSWFKCNDEDVTQVSCDEVLSLAKENSDNHIAYILLYGPCDNPIQQTRPKNPSRRKQNNVSSNSFKKRKVIQTKEKGNNSADGQLMKPVAPSHQLNQLPRGLKRRQRKKPAAPKRLTRSSSKLKAAAKLVVESDGELIQSEIEESLNEPQLGELNNQDGGFLRHLWDAHPAYPITADKLSVWKVGQKTTCSFLLEEHWQKDFPAIGTNGWTTARNVLMMKLEEMNMGKSINHKKMTKYSDWKCRQCCVFFGSYDGFRLHLKCHHFPSALMNDDEKQAAVICVDTLQSVEKRDKYFNPVAVWRCQFLFDCFQQKAIDKHFNVIKEAQVGTVFQTWAKKRGLRLPEIAQLKSTLLLPELNDAVWDIYRVKNWRFSKGSEPLSESDLQIAADSTFHFINQMKEQAKLRGKIYTFLLVPVDIATVIRADHDGDATKFLEGYNGNIIKQPLVAVVGKCSSSSLHSNYHFLSHAGNSSYTKNLLETGKYTPFRISSVPFKTDSSENYQVALAEQELAQILYVKMCISYTTAVQKKSKLHFVDHQKVEGHVLQDMLQRNPNFLKNIMEAVVMNNGEMFGKQNLAKNDSLQIFLSNPAELSLDEIKVKKGKRSTCPHCGYVAGSRNDQFLHQLRHSQNFPESSSVDRIFSLPWNFSDKKQQNLFLKNMQSWKHRQQNEKSEFYCYLLALDQKNVRNEHAVFQRLQRFLSDIEFRKANPDMFWFYAGKNSQNQGPSMHHLNGLSGLALTGRNSYTIKTWMFGNRQQQMDFEASLLLFAEKSEEYQDHGLHFVNRRLEFTAFENPLSLEQIRQIYNNVNDGKEVFSFANNTKQQEHQLYCDNQLDEATFSLHIHGSFKKKLSKEVPTDEEPGDEQTREKSSIRFPFYCKACGVGFPRYAALARHYSTCQVFKDKYPDEAATFMPRKAESQKSTKCSICKKEFGTSTMDRHHFQDVHQKMKKHQCAKPRCLRKFFSKSHLTMHERIHTGEKPYKCRFCRTRFTQQSSLIGHERTHTGAKPYKCGYCGTGFTQKHQLTRHEKIHTGEKPYKCRFCGKGFSREDYLIEHERTHTGAKPYKCGYCSTGFTQKHQLTRHERIHNNDKPYMCSFCEKRFSRPDTLVEHERVHTGAKPYKCSYCNKGFSQQSTLTTHERTHTGDKPYKCSHCSKGFAQKSALTRHERVHTGEKPYKCSLCNKEFAQKSTRNRHERTHKSIKPS